MAFSFVHAADLHLDSPFKGLTEQPAQSPHAGRVAGVLRSATFQAYDKLIQLCIERRPLFLLVVGDVYDGADRSLRAQLRFHDGLGKLAEHGIRSFVVHGNHDPLDGWSSSIAWPEGAHIFRGGGVETVVVQANGRPAASVSGISYPSREETRNLAAQFRPENRGLFQIALLHCNCGGDPNHEPYAPCSLQDLTGAGFDYWALGHVHTKSILDRNPHVAYPGNTQGRNIREPGERGCYFVTVREGKQVEVEFRPLDAVRWLSSELSIERFSAMNELDGALSEQLDDARHGAQGRPAVCRIALAGRGPLYHELNQGDALAALLERLREEGTAEDPFVWVEKLEFRCRPAIDLAQRRKTNDLLGQLLSISQELREAGDLPNALAPALDDLHGHKRMANALDALAPEQFEDLLSQAEYLCADLLEADE